MAGIVTNKGERKYLAAAIAGVGAQTVHLIKAPFVQSDNVEAADLVEADYDGYAPIPLSFLGLETGNPGGRAVGNFAAVMFTCTGNTTPNNIYGYWIDDGMGDVTAVERFSGSARPMQVSGQTIQIIFSLRFFSPV